MTHRGNSRRIDARRRQAVSRSAPFVAAIMAIGMALAGTAAAAPYVPTDDDQVLERLPSPTTQAARELRQSQMAVAQSPDRLEPAVALARQYIELGRLYSDPRYGGYAEAALRTWWTLPDPPVEVLVLRATLRQSRHEFDDALADLTRAIARDPTNAQAWLTRAIIQQVQGDPGDARKSCLKLTHLTTAIVAATCLANTDSIGGNAARAIDTLQRVLDNVPPGKTAAVQLWALTILAETAARLDRADAALRYFMQALSLGIHDSYLLGAYADFLLDRNQSADVIALLKDETRIDPLLLRLALAEQRTASPALPAHIAALKARFAASRQRGDTVHRREEARFTLDLLHDPGSALALAEANWAAQREPADARLLLEAALAAGRREAATPVLDWLARTRLEDVRIRRAADRLVQASP